MRYIIVPWLIASTVLALAVSSSLFIIARERQLTRSVDNTSPLTEKSIQEIIDRLLHSPDSEQLINEALTSKMLQSAEIEQIVNTSLENLIDNLVREIATSDQFRESVSRLMSSPKMKAVYLELFQTPEMKKVLYEILKSPEFRSVFTSMLHDQQPTTKQNR